MDFRILGPLEVLEGERALSDAALAGFRALRIYSRSTVDQPRSPSLAASDRTRRSSATGVIVTRRLSRIRSTAVAGVAVVAVAAPAALADTPVADHPGITVPAAAGQLVGDPVGDRFRPISDTQLVGDPVGDRFRPISDT
jgi:hypothetical protein